MTPTGRKIHERVIIESHLPKPLHIAILETPTGFEVNARHGWPERMEKFFIKGLANFHPSVTKIGALRKDGDHSTNDGAIVSAILSSDYIYSGAGSPSYVVTHLANSRALQNLITASNNGSILCLGSASAIASGRWALPVYEIFKAGHDLYWLKGLNLLSAFGLSVSIIPHWNNEEGEDYDSSRSWMGKRRFQALVKLLPSESSILGIDEQTACILDRASKCVTVMGLGSAHVMKGGKSSSFAANCTFPFSEIS